MPKQTQKTSQNYSNTAQYGWQNTPDTGDISAFRDFQPTADPTIPYRAASARNRVNASFNNPLGGYATPQIQDAQKRAAFRDIDEQAAMAGRAGQFDVNQQRMGQLGSLAALTAPRLTQTGSTGNSAGNTQVGQNTWGSILDLAMGAGSMAML